MPWNWQLPNWPNFSYKKGFLAKAENQFFLHVGTSSAFLKNVNHQEFVVEILSREGIESAKIEGEHLDRASLQSSIKKHFGLQASKKEGKKEAAMAQVLCDVYETFDLPLTHGMLFKWHAMLFKESTDLEDIGSYRTHKEPMQIVENRRGRVCFEAPPSSQIKKEMTAFIQYYNTIAPEESLLERTAILHLYFESIHPFEDGNGRIGRLLIEKNLSRGVGSPVLIAFSQELEKRKKEYYAALESCNQSLDAKRWLEFFANVLLDAQKTAIQELSFLMHKSRLMHDLADKINPRQEKVLLRLFAEGPTGFKGGLSAEKYIAITKTSKATATRDLQVLVEWGVLVKTGQLRHTRYWLQF